MSEAEKDHGKAPAKARRSWLGVLLRVVFGFVGWRHEFQP